MRSGFDLLLWTAHVQPLDRFERYFLNTSADAAAHLDRVKHPYVRATYDSFHANTEEKNLTGGIELRRDGIAHVHISENDRGTPGRGHIDFAPIFAALQGIGYDGWLRIKDFGRSLPQLAGATKVWRDFFPDPRQVYEEGFRLIRDGRAEAA